MRPVHKRSWILFALVLGLLPFSMTIRAQGAPTPATLDQLEDYDLVSPDQNVMIEPFYQMLGYVAPIRDYTGFIIDRDRLPFAPPVPELRRNIELPMLEPGDRRGIGYRTFRGEPPGTDLTIPPRVQTRFEQEIRYRGQLESEGDLPIYGLVTPIRPDAVR